MVVDAQVITDTHSVTNLLSWEGSSGPFAKVKLARSATGNRVRMSAINLETNATHGCVLYRLK